MPAKQSKKKAKRKKPGPKAMPPKWLEVVSLMTIGNLPFQEAMRAAGYKESYLTSQGHWIKRDLRFQKELERKKAERKTKSEDMRAKHLQILDSIATNASEATRDRTAALKEYAAIMGWHSETINHEGNVRQTVLDASAQAEAARLAAIALDTRSLPDIAPARRVVQSAIVASSTPDIPIIDQEVGANPGVQPEKVRILDISGDAGPDPGPDQGGEQPKDASAQGPAGGQDSDQDSPEQGQGTTGGPDRPGQQQDSQGPGDASP